jgi:hypothetical protein
VLRAQFQVSEQVACQVVSQPRTTQRYQPILRQDEDALTQAIVSLAGQYGRYGYRRVTALDEAGNRKGATGWTTEFQHILLQLVLENRKWFLREK